MDGVLTIWEDLAPLRLEHSRVGHIDQDDARVVVQCEPLVPTRKPDGSEMRDAD
ncbi:MAG: hypothetical protein ACRDTG_19665 [Pseudonocardiaceae bacterium]